MSGAVLKNVKTGKEKFFSQEDLASALRSGWRLKAGDRVNLKEAITGDEILADSATVEQHLIQGATPESTQSVRNRAREKRLDAEYGDGLWNTGQALLEGIGRGLTLGVSDYIAIGLGADPEGLRERRNRNTIAAPIGEIGGALLPLAFTGGAAGAGSLGRAMASTPAGIAARLGTRAGQAAGRSMAGMAAGGRVARTAAAIAPAGVQAGVEGAMFGAGMGASATVLSEDPFTAEALVSNMASGALYGGTIGAAVGSGFALIGHAGAGMSAIAKRRGDRAAAAARKKAGERSGPSAGKAKEFNDSIGAITTSGRQLDAFARKSRNAGAPVNRAFTDAYDDLIKARDRFESVGFHRNGKPMAVTDDNLKRFAAKEPAKYDEVIDAIESYRFAQIRMSEELVNVGASAVKPASKLPDDMLSPADYMRTVKAGQGAAEGVSGIDKLAAANEISDGVTGLGVDDVPGIGKLADMLLKLHLASRLMGGKGVPGAKALYTGRAVGSFAAAAGKAFGFGKHSGVRTWAANAYHASAAKIAKGSKAMFRTAPKSGAVTALATLRGASFGDRKTTPGRPTKSREKMTPLQRAGMDRMAEIRESVSDPEGTMRRLLKSTADLGAVDPALRQQVAAIAMKKMAYLNSKMPRGPSTGAVGTPHAKEYVPSDLELAKFARIVDAVENPEKILKNMGSMRLTPSEAHAVRDVYPTMYERIRVSIVETLASSKKPLSYQKLSQLSILWDLPVHSSMRPEFGSTLRSTFTREPDKAQPKPEMANLKATAESAETAIQRMAQK
jgi:hypothetical protein